MRVDHLISKKYQQSLDKTVIALQEVCSAVVLLAATRLITASFQLKSHHNDGNNREPYFIRFYTVQVEHTFYFYEYSSFSVPELTWSESKGRLMLYPRLTDIVH